MSTVNGSAYGGGALTNYGSLLLLLAAILAVGASTPAVTVTGVFTAALWFAVAWSLGVASWRMWDIARWKKQVSR